ncbi:MAG: hypothetical protein HOC23_09395 [Halieaceae bacterium]|nr:hypothetical protein [Halieaceae bacterium]
MAESLFTELKRRNVFRVGIAYLVLAWVVVQVTDSAVPALHLPEWVNTFVFFIGAVGFPFALFFAWIFEITPEGIKRESDIAPDESITAHTGRKLDFLIMGLLAVGMGYFIYESRFESESSETVVSEQISTKVKSSGDEPRESEGSSIAVLPFVNMSSDKEQEYFSDGISEEILNVLSKIPYLHVTSRSSAFSFKGKEIIISEVAKTLGVNNVLEGSVRKSGNRIRITAQLIDALTDKHLWSETYDRELDDIFAIQDEISAAIVSELRQHLGLKAEISANNQGRSNNTEAYEAYLKGRHLILQRTNETIIAAMRHYKYALELDPDFALAHAEMAIAQMLLVEDQYGDLIFEQASALARPHVESAMALAPELPEALAAAGLVLWNTAAPIETVEYFEAALKRSPNHATIINWLALVAGERGEYSKSLELQERLQTLDPLGTTNLSNLAGFYTQLGRFDDAKKIAKTLSALAPMNYQHAIASIAFDRGDRVAAVRAYLTAASLDAKSGLNRLYLGGSLFSLGLVDDAISIALTARPSHLVNAEHYKDVIAEFSNTDGPLSVEKKRWLGHALAATGNYSQALPMLEEVWISRERRVVAFGGFNIMNAMALIGSRRALNPSAEVNDLTQAIKEDIIRQEAVGYKTPTLSWTRAAIEWAEGHYDMATSHLNEASKTYNIRLPQTAYFLSELIKTPDYQALSQKIKTRQETEKAALFASVCKENPYSAVWSPQASDCLD